jgi:uroporphyrinogen decarboxylase
MNDRENLERTVRFQGPERIPMSFHINASCWHHYPQDALQELMAAHPLLFPGFTPVPGPVQVDIAAHVRAGRPFTDPWGCVWETADDGILGAVVEHPLERWENLEGYVPPDPDRVTHWGPIDWETQKREIGPSISQSSIRNGEVGHNHTWLRLVDIRGYANVLYDMADGEPRLPRLLEMLERFNLGLLENWIGRVGVQWMDFAEDLGMQVGPMLSPEHFRRYIKPSYRRLFARAREAGCIVHVHADGDIRTLVDDLLECGVDVLNLQDLVNGLEWIRERLRGRVCVELDIDRQSITFGGTPAQIDELIRREVETLGGREGGLMMIYGLYPGVPLANAEAVMEAMERYSGYFA